MKRNHYAYLLFGSALLLLVAATMAAISLVKLFPFFQRQMAEESTSSFDEISQFTLVMFESESVLDEPVQVPVVLVLHSAWGSGTVMVADIVFDNRSDPLLFRQEKEFKRYVAELSETKEIPLEAYLVVDRLALRYLKSFLSDDGKQEIQIKDLDFCEILKADTMVPGAFSQLMPTHVKGNLTKKEMGQWVGFLQGNEDCHYEILTSYATQE